MIEERLLNAVLNLFALQLACLHGPSRQTARGQVLAYLHHHIGLTNADIYLELLDELVEVHQGEPEDDILAEAAELALRLRTLLLRPERNAALFSSIKITALTPEAPALQRLADLLADGLGWSAHSLEVLLGFTNDPGATALSNKDCLLLGGGPDEAFRSRLSVLYLAAEEMVLVASLTDAGILLEGRPLIRNDCYLLRQGQVLRDQWGNELHFAQIVDTFTGDPAQGPSVALRGEGLEFCFPGGDYGIHDLTFEERGGRLVAIMGGSGAGKSTLLGLLNGTLRPSKGALLLNNRNVHADPRAVQGVFGLVPQDDLLFEDLTVFENLYYAAKLSLAHLPETELVQRVQALLADLGQTDAANLRVGSPLDKVISGGQRKRLNIALELIREPTILFVDEPTSGLSSADSEMVMGLLKQQADRGKLVFVVIHQPSSRIFRLFDALWVMDQGGWLIFRGTPLEAVSYFRSYSTLPGAEQAICPSCGSVNPEQILAIVEAKLPDQAGRPTQERRIATAIWRQFFEDHESGRTRPTTPVEPLPAPPKCLGKPGGFGQFKVFFSRDCRARLANKTYLAITLLEPPLLGLVMGLVARGAAGDQYAFHDNKNLLVFLFMSVIVALFLGLSVSAEEICRDGKIQKRERFLNLSWWSYINSKALYLALVSCLQSLLYLAVAIPLVQLPDMFFNTWAILSACAFASCLLGLNISATLRSAVNIYILIPLLLVPQMLLSGVIIDYEDLIPPDSLTREVPGYANLLPSRWGFEALVVEQYSRNAYMRNFIDVDARQRLAEYDLDYFLPELQGRVQSILIMSGEGRHNDAIAFQLNILENEFRRLEARSGKPTGLRPDDFRIGAFNENSAGRLDQYITDLRRDIFQQRNTAATEKHAIESRLEQLLGHESLEALHNRHTNSHIEKRMLNLQELEPIGETREGLFHRTLPIYRLPESRWGGAHFLADHKRIGNRLLSTYAFNLAMILFIGFFLYLALGFRLLPVLFSNTGLIADRLLRRKYLRLRPTS